MPSASATCRNSISRIALRTAIPASAIMPIIAVAVKKSCWSSRPPRPRHEVQQPEARHDADHRERDRDHQNQGHGVAPGLEDQDGVDAEQRDPEGDAEIAEHVAGDLELSLAEPGDPEHPRQLPGNPAPAREVGPAPERARSGRLIRRGGAPAGTRSAFTSATTSAGARPTGSAYT